MAVANTSDTVTSGIAGSDPIPDFLIAQGGPFHELQRRRGLLHVQAQHDVRRAVVFVGLAWGVPLALCVLQGDAIGPKASHPFLLSLDAWARFLVAIALFVVMERTTEQRLRDILWQFPRGPLIAPPALPAAASAVRRALDRRSSRISEALCVLLAYRVAGHHAGAIRNDLERVQHTASSAESFHIARLCGRGHASRARAGAANARPQRDGRFGRGCSVIDNLPDAGKSYETVTKLSTTLFSRASLLPVAAAATLPLIAAAAAATTLAGKDLLGLGRRRLLL